MSNGTASAYSKKSSKLELFLKRLDEKYYEEVRATESCIIDFGKEQGEKFVILTPHSIDFTNKPPTKLQKGLELSKIITVRLSDVLPPFLTGDDQINTQHITIEYKEEDTSKIKEGISPRLSWTPSKSLRKINSTPPPSPRRTDSNASNLSNLSSDTSNGMEKTLSFSDSPSDGEDLKLDLSSLSTNGSDNGSTPRSIKSSSLSKRKKMDLYILRHTSTFYMLLKAALNSYHIRSTLELEPDYKIIREKKQRYSAFEKLSILFNVLKNEIMHCNINDKNKFFLAVEELYTTSERNFALRKHFWKDNELFTKLITVLKATLMGKNTLKKFNTVMNSLEMGLLIIDTLISMLTETEVIFARQIVLKANEGVNLVELLHIVMDDHKGLCLESFTTSQRKEFNEKRIEILNANITLMNRLILAAEQSTWTESRESFFNVNWLMKQVQSTESLPSFILKTVETVVETCRPKRECSELSPKDLVILYYKINVTYKLIQFLEEPALLIRDHFLEEFRYYMTPSNIHKTLQDNFSLKLSILKELEEIIKTVLQKPFSLECDSELGSLPSTPRYGKKNSEVLFT
ncbi:DgyrCDS6657 [Dimorphilus gyrociliatus]|uniref:DgyrCDS6657 n=2 Tax=Dimorphilus gyrociliatus TaxID=2664684 RepID=A0A7I8VNT8_9ANNE|nr:DgyrCDS6657 [Dimorphilus gyrociliatus]